MEDGLQERGEEWKCMKHALLGWPKRDLPQKCQKDRDKNTCRPPKLALLGKTEGKVLFQQSYVNVVKLPHWVAELVLGDCHNIDGEFGKLILNLSLPSSPTLAP